MSVIVNNSYLEFPSRFSVKCCCETRFVTTALELVRQHGVSVDKVRQAQNTGATRAETK
jgi:putative lipoic acid-binding regulatory protein